MCIVGNVHKCNRKGTIRQHYYAWESVHSAVHTLHHLINIHETAHEVYNVSPHFSDHTPLHINLFILYVGLQMPREAASSVFLYLLHLLSEIYADCVDVHMSVSAGVLKRLLCAKSSVLCHLQGLHPLPSISR